MERNSLYQSNNYVADLNDLRLTGQLCDVTIKVDETLFCAHKVILASRLKYFKTRFIDQGRTSDVVNLEMIKKNNLELLISFAYTGEIAITESNVLSLLKDAHQLNETGIKKACINFLEKYLISRDAAKALQLAQDIDCFELKIIAKKMIPIDFDKLSKTTEYLELNYDSLERILTAGDMESEEMQQQYFEGVMKWIIHDLTNRRSRLIDLLGLIDMKRLTTEYLWDYLSEHVADNDNDGIVKDVMTTYRNKKDRFKKSRGANSKHRYNKRHYKKDRMKESGEVKENPKLEQNDDNNANEEPSTSNSSEVISNENTDEQRKDDDDDDISQVTLRKPSTRSQYSNATEYNSDDQQLLMSTSSNDDTCELNLDEQREDNDEVFTQETPNERQLSKKLMITNMYDNTVIQFYDFSQNTWSELLTLEREVMTTSKSGVILNGKLYFLQATNVKQELMQEHLRVIDYKTEECVTLEIRQNNLSGSTICACDRYLYFCGGITEMGQVTRRIQRYDPKTNEIEALGPLMTERCGAAAVIYQGCLHVLGGRNRIQITNSVEKFDETSMEWIHFPSMCEPRRQFAVAILDGKLYACGGQRIKTVEVYDPEVKRWKYVAKMNNARYGFLVIPHDGKLIAIGGDRFGTIEVYDPTENRWHMDDRLLAEGLLIRNPIGGFIYSV